MRIKRLRYRQKKFHQESKFKSILLTFFAAIFISACGIKGDLYETPEQASSEQNTMTEQGAVSQKNGVSQPADSQKKSVTMLEKSEQPQAAQQPIEQAINPSDKQSTDPIKE
ncbi:lipoprotein [Colwellia piezophila]|uniref:LptM family lipoprotein n=1 Tax=Colwellia piezophila TaxID=211668 RepID=UPI0012F8351A|nr:lipoprotein [Colwellia piezophila]